MKRKVYGVTLLIAVVLGLSGCSNKALEEAKAAVDNYNAQAVAYNETVSKYNERHILRWGSPLPWH